MYSLSHANQRPLENEPRWSWVVAPIDTKTFVVTKRRTSTRFDCGRYQNQLDYTLVVLASIGGTVAMGVQFVHEDEADIDLEELFLREG